MATGRIPPHSSEAEKSVLGSILIDRDAIINAGDILNSDDFYDGSHSAIYECMIELFKKARPIDIVTVSEYLQNNKQLDTVGGNAYIAELSNTVPSSTNMHEYITIVKTKSVLRRLIKSGGEVMNLGYKESDELSTLLEQAEKSIFNVTQAFMQNKLVHVKEVAEERQQSYHDINENPELITRNRVYTGFKGLDNMFNGLKGGDMVIVAARPSMGKTAFALNIGTNVAAQGKSVAVFSLEMSKEQLVDRMVCSKMGIDSWKLQKGQIEDHEFAKLGEVIAELGQSKIYIDDSAAMTMLEIKSKCRRLKIESGLDIVIIDYLQLIHGTNPNNRVQEVGEISRGIKALARELDCPVVALSQLSRGVESRTSKEPILSDLRESGSIEQDADSVMMIYREDYYVTDMADNDINKGLTSIFVRKNRSGSVGDVQLKFDAKFQKFREIDTAHTGF